MQVGSQTKSVSMGFRSRMHVNRALSVSTLTMRNIGLMTDQHTLQNMPGRCPSMVSKSSQNRLTPARTTNASPGNTLYIEMVYAVSCVEPVVVPNNKHGVATLLHSLL